MPRTGFYSLVCLVIIGCGGESGGINTDPIIGETPTISVATEANVTSEQRKIVDRHNYYRNDASGTIPDLVWDGELAKHAQTWANYLAENYSNDDANNKQSPHATEYQIGKHEENDYKEGENIGFSTKRIGFVDSINGHIDTNKEYVYHAKDKENELLDIDGVIDVWASEAYYYDYRTNKSNTSGKAVGHYTQIIWKDTTKVGCGKAISKVYNFFNNVDNVYYEIQVCRYSPPGNFEGNKPY